MPELGVQRINKLSACYMRSLVVALTASLEDLRLFFLIPFQEYAYEMEPSPSS